MAFDAFEKRDDLINLSPFAKTRHALPISLAASKGLDFDDRVSVNGDYHLTSADVRGLVMNCLHYLTIVP